MGSERKNAIFSLLQAVEPGCREFFVEPFVLVRVGHPAETVNGYERVVALAQSFLLSASPKEMTVVEKAFVKTVLISNGFWAQRLVADLWCLVARYGSSDYCRSHVLTLISVMLALRRHAADDSKMDAVAALLYRLSSFLGGVGAAAMENDLSAYRSDHHVLAAACAVNVNKMSDDFKKGLHQHCFEVRSRRCYQAD